MQRVLKLAPRRRYCRNGPEGLSVSMPPPWNPLSLPNLLTWFDASDSSTISNPSAVTQWRDKSLNANHLTPGVTAATGVPLVAASTLAGRDTMSFLGKTYFNLATKLTNVRSAFILCKWADTTGYYRVIFGDDSGYQWHSDVVGSEAPLLSTYADGSIVNGSKYINGVLTEGYLSRYTTWTQHGFITLANTVIGNLSMDRTGYGYDRQFKGNIAEVVIMSTVATNADRLALQAYWTAKWGI